MRSKKRTFDLTGYSLLDQSGEGGIRYTWRVDGKRSLVESAAFDVRARIKTSDKDHQVSAYTTSIGAGCILKAFHMECIFCRTGRCLPFIRHLTPEEIAIQNVLMVLADMNCPDRPSLREKEREFAYMGQGEPGFSYPQVRSAIILTNHVMQRMNQRVFRHIVATCGVPEMLDALRWDLEQEFYANTRVTVHFSLHACKDRSKIMPINDLYSYSSVIPRLSRLHKISGEKPCVGILMFKNFRSTNHLFSYSNNDESLEVIAEELDPNYHRISLCEYNPSKDVGHNDILEKDEAENFLRIFSRRNIEGKLFASFGRNEDTACGLLGGTKPNKPIGKTLQNHYHNAVNLVNEATQELCG